jgi:hypothetical protein
MKNKDIMGRPVQRVGLDPTLQDAAVQMTFDIDQIIQRWYFDHDPKRQNHGIDNGSRKGRPNRRPMSGSAQTAGQPGDGPYHLATLDPG